MKDSSLNIYARKTFDLNLFARKVYDLNLYSRRHVVREVVADTILGFAGSIGSAGIQGFIIPSDIVLGLPGTLSMSGIQGSIVTDAPDTILGSVGSIGMSGVEGSIISKDRILGSVGSLSMSGIEGSIVEGASSVVDATYNGFDENSTGADNLADLSIPIPVNAVAGSLAVLVACKDSSTESLAITETGWSVRKLEEFTVSGQSIFMTIIIATKVLDASDITNGSVQLTWSTAEKVSGIIIASNTNGGYDKSDTNHVFASSVSVPSIAVASDGSLVIHGFVQRGQEVTLTTPAGQNNITEISGSGAGATKVRAMYETGIASGNSTAHSYTVNADQPLIGFTIIVSGS